MTGVRSTTTIETITITEAIHDYKQAYKDYKEQIEKANKYYENDKEVLKTILTTYFPAAQITVKGNLVTLSYCYDRPFLDKKFKEQIEEITHKYTIHVNDEYMTVHMNLKED